MVCTVQIPKCSQIRRESRLFHLLSSDVPTLLLNQPNIIVDEQSLAIHKLSYSNLGTIPGWRLSSLGITCCYCLHLNFGFSWGCCFFWLLPHPPFPEVYPQWKQCDSCPSCHGYFLPITRFANHLNCFMAPALLSRIDYSKLISEVSQLIKMFFFSQSIQYFWSNFLKPIQFKVMVLNQGILILFTTKASNLHSTQFCWKVKVIIFNCWLIRISRKNFSVLSTLQAPSHSNFSTF
mgnify:CR=1 FL=1